MEGKVELIFIPLPGAGHLVSAVEIAKLILDRDERLCISFLIMKLPTDLGVQSYIESLTSITRLQFVDITLYDKTPTEISTNKWTFIFDFTRAHQPKVKEFVCSKSFSSLSSSCQLAGFVVDMFCISMIDIAREFSVPTYIFFTSNASLLGLCFHFESLRKEHHVDMSKYKNSNEELQVPGFENPYPAKFLPSRFTEQREVTNLLFDFIAQYRETNGIIINTFVELEPFATQSLSALENIPPIYPVGPVVNFQKSDHDLKTPSETENIVNWLDEQPKSSVVFLCFGSMGSFEPNQVWEIAMALESCGHRFLWSLRKPPPKEKMEMPSAYENFEEVLPEGFLERTNGLGKVIGWALQAAVLSHPAVGGFVSHCGWNSILESLWCGVPIATWPQYAEQNMNAFLLVKELGLATEIRIQYYKGLEEKDEVDSMVSSKEIENGIRQLMAVGDNNEIRKKVNEMKEISNASMRKDGSSYASLGLLIEDVIRESQFT